MNAWIKAEYLRLRAKGWQGSDALRAARVKDAFDDAANDDLVKLVTEPEYEAYDASYIDTWVHVSERQREYWRKQTFDRIDRDGLWCLVGYVMVDGEWESVDSCGMFIGDDWEDSGYDVDIRQACLDRLDELNGEQAATLAQRATLAGPA